MSITGNQKNNVYKLLKENNFTKSINNSLKRIDEISLNDNDNFDSNVKQVTDIISPPISDLFSKYKSLLKNIGNKSTNNGKLYSDSSKTNDNMHLSEDDSKDSMKLIIYIYLCPIISLLSDASANEV